MAQAVKFSLVECSVVPNPDHGGFDVTPIWSGVDRPITSGWCVTSKSVAERLRRAVMAGAAIADVRLATDLNGNTYVANRHVVSAKRANADLRALGF